MYDVKIGDKMLDSSNNMMDQGYSYNISELKRESPACNDLQLQISLDSDSLSGKVI